MCIYPALLLSLISVTQGSVHRVLRSSTILHNQGNDLPRAKEMDRRRPQSIPVIRQQTEVEPDSFLSAVLSKWMCAPFHKMPSTNAPASMTRPNMDVQNAQ